MSPTHSPSPLLVFGSINTDMVVYLPRLPFPGETVSGGTYASFPGGKGANAAVAARRSGVSVFMYGAVGSDIHGAERIRSLAEEGIVTAGIRVKQGVASGIAQIWVDAQGENSIAVAPGANAELSVTDVGDLAAASCGAVAVFQNEIPQETTESLIRSCKHLGCTTVWNVAPECSVAPQEATLRSTDYLLFNQNEIVAFSRLLHREGAEVGQAGRLDLDGAERAAARLLAAGARNVIVTLGRFGSVCVGPAGAHRQLAFEVAAVDTVGAGDCFCGVLAASLACGLPLSSAMERAAAAAAISVTRRGAQTSMPSEQEIRGFLEGHREGSPPLAGDLPEGGRV